MQSVDFCCPCSGRERELLEDLASLNDSTISHKRTRTNTKPQGKHNCWETSYLIMMNCLIIN